MNLNSIVVGYDGSVESEEAVRWAVRLAHGLDATVTVLHAAGILERLDTPFRRSATPEAVERIVAEERLDAARCHWVVDDGDACSALLRSAAPPIGAQLLVVGSRGHGKRPGMLIGSVSLEVVQHAAVPVVVIPGFEAPV